MKNNAVINFNLEKINKTTNNEIKNESEMIEHIKKSLRYLLTHNKNLTKTQYFTIANLDDIFNCIE